MYHVCCVCVCEREREREREREKERVREWGALAAHPVNGHYEWRPVLLDSVGPVDCCSVSESLGHVRQTAAERRPVQLQARLAGHHQTFPRALLLRLEDVQFWDAWSTTTTRSELGYRTALHCSSGARSDWPASLSEPEEALELSVSLLPSASFCMSPSGLFTVKQRDTYTHTL